MRGVSNSSLFFWLWLIFIEASVFVSGSTLEIPALGRISYGIGSFYDGRTGNFLPLQFSALSKTSRHNPNYVVRKLSYGGNTAQKLVRQPAEKLGFTVGLENSHPWSYMNKQNGLALRAVLDMLDFPENGTAGLLLDKITQEEMTSISTETFIIYQTGTNSEDELILPKKQFRFLNETEKVLRADIRRKFLKSDMKILKKATHVVVKVTRGSKKILRLDMKKNTPWVKNINLFGRLDSFNSSSVSSFRLFSDSFGHSNFNSTWKSDFDSAKDTLNKMLPFKLTSDSLFPPSVKNLPEGVPLYFELMPLLEFLNKSGLNLAPASLLKFQGLNNWTDPIEIDHTPTFDNLDSSWKLMRQILELNVTLHQCLNSKENQNPRKDAVVTIIIMLVDLEYLYEDFNEKFTKYKRYLRSLLEKSSTGTKQDAKMWKSIYDYSKSNGSGIHWNFVRVLRTVQEKYDKLGGKNEDPLYYRYYSKYADGKKGCDAIQDYISD